MRIGSSRMMSWMRMMSENGDVACGASYPFGSSYPGCPSGLCGCACGGADGDLHLRIRSSFFCGDRVSEKSACGPAILPCATASLSYSNGGVKKKVFWGLRGTMKRPDGAYCCGDGRLCRCDGYPPCHWRRALSCQRTGLAYLGQRPPLRRPRCASGYRAPRVCG